MGKDIATADHENLIKALAWEVSRNVIDHHRWVYSQIFKSAPSTFPVSLRNGIYNEISSAIKCQNDNQIREWIERSKAHRKEMQRLKRKSTTAQKESKRER